MSRGIEDAEAKLNHDIDALQQRNRKISRRNSLIAATLSRLTDQYNLGPSPEAWSAWWAEQDGRPADQIRRPYELSPPVTKVTITRSVYIPFLKRGRSCFAAGTLVQAREGLRPIESFRVGDQVLSQDVTTGALSFQPVVAVIHNSPKPTWRIDLAGESFVATGIHRFWKAGQGWVMARDLKAGDPLRILDGLAEVSAVATDQVQPVFNLEVATNQTFFVGRSGVLVHDNSLVLSAPEPFDAVADPVAIARASSAPPPTVSTRPSSERVSSY
jgi:hypothetical protein